MRCDCAFISIHLFMKSSMKKSPLDFLRSAFSCFCDELPQKLQGQSFSVKKRFKLRVTVCLFEISAGLGSSTELQVLSLQAVNSRAIRVVFVVPQIFLGLHGRVDFQYTKERYEKTT